MRHAPVVKIGSGLYIFLLFTIVLMPCPLRAYEEEPAAYLTDILSPELNQSLKHRVEDVEVRQGVFHFFLQSDFGSFNISTLGMLRERVKEILILGNAVNEFAGQEDRFSDEIRGRLEIRSDKAVDIIKRPVSSATNLAGQVVENLNETFTGAAPETEKAYKYTGGDTDDPVRSLHKRNAASQWQLDVYSTNPKVGEFLNAVATARSSGRISAGAPSFNRYSIPPLKVLNEALEIEIRSALKDYDFDSLKENNKRILAGLNISRDLQTAFQEHPAYSPRHKTRISHYMNLLGHDVDLSGLIRAALGSRDESSSLAFEHLVMMLADYHSNRNEITEIWSENSNVYAVTEGNQLVHFVVQDIIYWNETTESLYKRLSSQALNGGREAWNVVTSGFVTEEAKKQLNEQGFEILQQYLY